MGNSVVDYWFLNIETLPRVNICEILRLAAWLDHSALFLSLEVPKETVHVRPITPPPQSLTNLRAHISELTSDADRLLDSTLRSRIKAAPEDIADMYGSLCTAFDYPPLSIFVGSSICHDVAAAAAVWGLRPGASSSCYPPGRRSYPQAILSMLSLAISRASLLLMFL